MLTRLRTSEYQEVHDPEIASRIESYELANRMQTAAPELIDLSNSLSRRDAYGVGRKEPEKVWRGSWVTDDHDTFARNCLLASPWWSEVSGLLTPFTPLGISIASWIFI